jgi:nitrite reductase/ring-hydroxylating ferredoxin subunit
MTDLNSSDDCAGCALKNAGNSRREFLRDAALALAALAATGATAGALPVHLVRAIARTGETATYPFPAVDGVYIDKKNEVIVARVASQVFAFELACPHQNTALRWNASVHRFQCPKHHSQYGADGTFIEGRATRSMDRFAVKRDGGNLVVDLDKVYEQDKDGAGWKAAAVAGG